MEQMSTAECVTLLDWDDAGFVRIYFMAEAAIKSGSLNVNSLQGMLATSYAQGRKRGRADTAVTFIVKDQE